jgi:hypothetical protein
LINEGISKPGVLSQIGIEESSPKLHPTLCLGAREDSYAISKLLADTPQSMVA